MYHSLVRLLLVGLSDEARDVIENSAPLDAFTHEISASPTLDPAQAAAAHLIIADVTEGNAAELASSLLDLKGADTELILIATSEQADELVPLLDRLTDLWRAPLSLAELRFRFARWQRARKAAADAWQTNQYLEATINSIPSLVWYKSDDGIHHKVNDAFCATVNKTKEQVQGRGHAYIWDVETDDPACIESERRVMESRSTIVSEETVQTSDGTRLLTTYKSPLYDLDGSVMGTVGVGIDVTQERAYEDEIIQKNRTLETIFTTMECGVITHSTDGSRILGINQAALDMLGYRSEEAMVAQGFDMVAPSVLPEDAKRLRESFASLKHVGDAVSTEYRVRHEDGSITHIMGNIKLIESDGELLYQRFLLDYTDKKLEEVRKERRSRDLIQALSEDYLLVCSFNLDSGLGEALRADVEDERHLNVLFSGELTLRDFLTTYIERFVFEEDRAMLGASLCADNLKEELSDATRIHVNYRTRRGEAVEYCQATVVRTSEWKERHDVVLGLRSVDEQTRDEMKKKAILEDALAQANRANEAKSVFLSNMSHDIRTPMNAIVGFTTLAASRIDQPEKVQEYLDKIRSSSTHLLSLINDILDMSRIESGKVSLDEQPCNLPALLDDLYSIIQAETSARQLYFSINTDEVRHPDVLCDRLRINQVLLNLLGNALKFTHPGGFIKVTVTELPGAPVNYSRYRFIVSDTGIGMSPEFVEHIFDPFERERTSTISGIQGTGLGMAITKNLVDMMHGTISVESEKDKGTVFTVDLMLQLANADATAHASKTFHHVEPHHSMRGSRILLVDDNDLNREIAITLLEDEGFVVEYAVDGQQAVDALKAAGPDHFQLVLMDVQMPVMNGYEATKAIRKLPDKTLANIPILAMTADAFEEDRQKALRSGMDGHLTKPLEIDKLFEALNIMLA